MDHNNETHEDDVEHRPTTSVVNFSNDTHHNVNYHSHYHFVVNNANGNVSQAADNAEGDETTDRTATASVAGLINKPTYRVYTKANPSFCLTIRRGNVVLAEFDQTNEHQLWHKVDDYNSLVKDRDGSIAFALVNKITVQAIKHSVEAYHPVQLVPYRPLSFDESILWTEGPHCFDGYRSIRMVNNTQLHFDAFGGGKVQDGTAIILWKWTGVVYQKWKIHTAE